MKHGILHGENSCAKLSIIIARNMFDERAITPCIGFAPMACRQAPTSHRKGDVNRAYLISGRAFPATQAWFIDINVQTTISRLARIQIGINSILVIDRLRHATAPEKHFALCSISEVMTSALNTPIFLNALCTRLTEYQIISGGVSIRQTNYRQYIT